MKNSERLFGMDMPRPVARAIAVLLAVVVYATVASVVRPDKSSAAQPGGPTITPAKQLPGIRAGGSGADRNSRANNPTTAPERNARGWRLLGELVGGENLVWVYGSPDGPRYTICTADGRVLQEDLAPEDVYRSFPKLDLTDMRLEPRPDGSTGEPLMTADHGGA